MESKYSDEEYKFYIERIGADKILEEAKKYKGKIPDIETLRAQLELSPEATDDFIKLCFHYTHYNAIRRL